MELLVLGGTAFLSRAVAEHAVAAGHRVTCLARGSAAPPEGVEFVRADRDREDGLEALAGRRFDAVIDVARQPGQVGRAVRDLATPHRVFVSTANVYATQDLPERDESTPLLAPLREEVATPEQYGAAKVACEELVRAAPGTATVVRAGLIGGPGDVSGRTGYYVWRFAHPTGPDVLAPDDPEFRCGLIDVRDLAAWIVHAAERRLDGAFNADGESVRLADHLATAREVAGAERIGIRWVPPATLTEAGVSEWMGPRSLPLWIGDPEWRHFATLGTAAARREGLVTRPLAETLADTLAWEERRSVPRNAGLSDADERALRARLDRAGVASEQGGVSRRTVLIAGGGLLAAGAVAATGWAAMPLRYRYRIRGELGLNPDPYIPDVPEGQVSLDRFDSAHMAAFDMFSAVPDGYGAGEGLPVLVVLHGASARTEDMPGFGFGRFVTAAARDGHPMVLVGPEDGPSGWLPEAGSDPFRMLAEEVLPAWLAERGWDAERRSLWGWSRGGRGALAFAIRYPGWARSLALFSPALSSRDPLVEEDLSHLADLPLGIWCGREDSFNAGARALVKAWPGEPEVVSLDAEGLHTREYWNSVTKPMLRWTGSHLG